ncbi:hypothetical protein QB607_003151 [Clostridium botulinum]|nr:hypothetical protein [Clostridium botulinum]EKS4395824.1 hypothetical protein [Clostridium botulinum]
MNYDELVFCLLRKTKGISFRQIDDFLTNLDDDSKDKLIDNEDNVFVITKHIFNIDEVKGTCECNYEVEINQEQIKFV